MDLTKLALQIIGTYFNIHGTRIGTCDMNVILTTIKRNFNKSALRHQSIMNLIISRKQKHQTIVMMNVKKYSIKLEVENGKINRKVMIKTLRKNMDAVNGLKIQWMMGANQDGVLGLYTRENLGRLHSQMLIQQHKVYTKRTL